MLNNRIQISKKEDSLKGDDGYKIFSVRVKDETVAALDKIAGESNCSRNQLINIFLEYGAENNEITE